MARCSRLAVRDGAKSARRTNSWAPAFAAPAASPKETAPRGIPSAGRRDVERSGYLVTAAAVAAVMWSLTMWSPTRRANTASGMAASFACSFTSLPLRRTT